MTNKNNINKIKNIEYLKKIQIVCRNDKDIEDCLNMLEELGFEVRNNDNQYQVIFYRQYGDLFENDVRLECGVDTYFFNKKLIKTLQEFIREKEEKKEKKEKEEKKKIEDFEFAKDRRIIKINNKQSEKKIFVVYDGAYNYDYEYYKENATKIADMAQNYLDFIVKYGMAYETKEARDRAVFKIEIETKLKNIAERLNKGQKIDWEDKKQYKFHIYYDYRDKILKYFVRDISRVQGAIYCLDENFLNVAKQEIGEDNLIKYFGE